MLNNPSYDFAHNLVQRVSQSNETYFLTLNLINKGSIIRSPYVIAIIDTIDINPK